MLFCEHSLPFSPAGIMYNPILFMSWQVKKKGGSLLFHLRLSNSIRNCSSSVWYLYLLGGRKQKEWRTKSGNEVKNMSLQTLGAVKSSYQLQQESL